MFIFFFVIFFTQKIPESYFLDRIPLDGIVERVIDGDTVRFRHAITIGGGGGGSSTVIPASNTLKIRLYGIDCPEVAKSKQQTDQAFAVDAKNYTNKLTFNKRFGVVTVTPLSIDRYGRLIGILESTNSEDVSMQLAKNGFAELYTGGGAQYAVRMGFFVFELFPILLSSFELFPFLNSFLNNNRKHTV